MLRFRLATKIAKDIIFFLKRVKNKVSITNAGLACYAFFTSTDIIFQCLSPFFTKSCDELELKCLAAIHCISVTKASFVVPEAI